MILNTTFEGFFHAMHPVHLFKLLRFVSDGLESGGQSRWVSVTEPIKLCTATFLSTPYPATGKRSISTANLSNRKRSLPILDITIHVGRSGAQVGIPI